MGFFGVIFGQSGDVFVEAGFEGSRGLTRVIRSAGERYSVNSTAVPFRGGAF